jgi:enoyl-CoA hydratase/carnithine racemase
MALNDIRVETEGAIGHLVLARSARNNALHPQMLQEICAGLDQLAAEEAVRAIVIRADGKHFSVGADFEWLGGLRATPSINVERDIYAHFQGAARRIYHCPKPTIAAVNGAAITVSCELALACDFRIVSPSARFQESWVKLGLMPPLGGLFLLPRMVGLARASQLVLRGEVVSAEQAVAWGMALEVVAEDGLVARASELAGELAALPPTAYAAVKQAMHRGLETSMEAEWSANTARQALLIGSEDFGEALLAVQERRTGQFHGR